MGPRYSYRFLWHVHAAPADVVAAVSDIEHYPLWWRSFSSMVADADGSFLAAVPDMRGRRYSVRMTPELVIPQEGRLQTALSGDIVGFARFDVVRARRGSRLNSYEDEWTQIEHLEEFDIVHPSLRRLAGLLPGGVRLHQALSMRWAVRGLDAYLSTSSVGRSAAG